MDYRASAGQPSDLPPESSDAEASAGRRGGAVPPLAAALGGAVAIGAVAGAMLINNPSAPPAINLVAPQDRIQAIATLDGDAARAAQSDRRECSYPMGFVTVVSNGGVNSGTIRLVTSKYRSPPFPVSSVPQRIAIPHPLPATGGVDVLTIDGAATALTVALSPAAIMTPTTANATVRVYWPPSPACKS